MKNLKLLKWLFLIVVLFSCKSIKKDKKRTITEDIKIEKMIDTSLEKQNITLDIKQKDKEIVTEETTNTHAVFVVNGQEVLKPVTTTKKVTEKDGEVITSGIESKVTENNIVTDSSNLNKTEDLDLKKESEGMEIVKELVDGLLSGMLGSAGKFIILSILGLILIFVLIKVFKSKKENDNI